MNEVNVTGVPAECAQFVTLWGNFLGCVREAEHPGGCHYRPMPEPPAPVDVQ